MLTTAPVCMCVQILSCLTPIDLYLRVSLLVVVDIVASNTPGKGLSLYGQISTLQRKDICPLNGQLQHDIVKAHHDSPVTIHPSLWIMTELLTCNFWWTRINCYVEKYVKCCDLCNQMKIPFLWQGSSCPSESQTIGGRSSQLI